MFRSYTILLFANVAWLATFGIGGEITPESSTFAENPIPESSSSSLWDLPILYLDEENPTLQEFRITGRYQGQYANVDSNQGDFDDWEHRRWRLGAEARLFHRFTASATVNLDHRFEPFYESLDSADVAVRFTDALNLVIGKFKPKWSHEWSTSSKHILTFERSLLVNQTRPRKSSGLSAFGAWEKWNYRLGVFSGDRGQEFGDFDGGAFFLGSIGYDLSQKARGLDRLLWRLDYLYNDPEPDDAGAAPYEHSWASSLALGRGDFNWVNEVIYVTGMSPDAYGFSSLASYDLTDQLQGVVRYQYAHGDDDSLRLQSRYERQVAVTDGGHGEDYHAIYAGLNYYIHNPNLKLMAGAEWSTMDGGDDGGDYDGWTWFGGIRLFF